MAGSSADLVLINARIYTVNPAQEWASAVAISAGRIVYVGTDDGAKALAGEESQVVDLQGRMVLPSFQDTHVHLSLGGINAVTCPLYGLTNIEEYQQKIRKCAKADPGASIIRGYGWDGLNMPDGAMPRKEWLDVIDSSRPMVFGDASGHAMWANSKAFEQYGITMDTPDPPGGMIERDPESGELSGVVHEDTGMALITDRWPAFTDEELKTALRAARDYMHSMGITAVQDALVKLNSRDTYPTLPAMAALEKSGELGLRLSASLFWESGEDVDTQIADFIKARQQYNHGRLRVNTVKFWADGVIETHTAMLLDPYTDKPDTHGLLMIPRAEMMEAIPAAIKAGFQAHIHAIGDATVRYGLDALEVANRQDNAAGTNGTRHHTTHAQFVHPDDLPRFAALGMGLSMQPYWASDSAWIEELTLPRVGPERIQWSYLIGSLHRSGAKVAFASDWSVSSANPLLGIETAVTRIEPDTDDWPVFLPDERIDLAAAIAGYTINAAYLNFLDKDTGTIEPGKYADLVVLDRDLFAIPTDDIADASVVTTILEGEVVFGKLEP